MIKKILFLILLTLLFITIGLTAFAQTAYFKDKFKEYLIKKSPIDLKIETLEGVFPFWMKVKEVSLNWEGSSSVTIREGSFTLSPFALLIKKLTFIHLHLKEVTVKKEGESSPLSCPIFPIALEIYSLEIEDLLYNTLPALTLSGAVDITPCGGPFFLNLDIREQQISPLLLHINIDADALTQKIALITNLRRENFDLWAGGTLSLEEKTFLGSLHGNGEVKGIHKPWTLSSTIEMDPYFAILCKDFTLNINEVMTIGSLNIHTENDSFTFTGTMAEEPLTAQGELHWKPGKGFSLSSFIFNYIENQAAGNLLYDLSTHEIDAEIDINAKEVAKAADILKKFWDFEDKVEGEMRAHLFFHKEEIVCKAELTNFHWNQFYISKGSFDSHWQEEKPLAFTLDIYDFAVLRSSYEVLPMINIKAEGTLTDKMFKLAGTAGGLGEEPFTIECKIPTHLTFKPFSYSIDEKSPFSIKFSGHGSIDPLLAFLENASLIVQGNIDGNVEISGLWKASQITGYIIFSKGRIQSLATGALFQNVEMKFKGEGECLSITSLTAQDSDSGRIDGKGEISWNGKEHFPFHINFKAHNFLLFALDPFTASTDAAIAISGNLKEVAIKGDTTIVKGLITIPNKLPVTIPTLEVTYLNPLPALSFEDELPPSFPIKVNWDIAVHIPKKLEIEGRGFYSEWKGDMKIEGINKELKYTGELTLHQGRFDFARHNFHLNNGKIKIEGIEAKEFYIDVEGETEASNIMVFMNVKGYLNSTKMTFTSIPSMSTEQIFSRLLFDSDLNELTPFQACRLAKFLVTLSGKYAGPSAFDTFKDTLGIDVFDITYCNIDAMDFTFQVGKYISQGTYVGINKSISGDFDSIEIQTRLYEDFFLQANYGGSLNGLTPNGGKIIFKWYKTY